MKTFLLSIFGFAIVVLAILFFKSRPIDTHSINRIGSSTSSEPEEKTDPIQIPAQNSTQISASSTNTTSSTPKPTTSLSPEESPLETLKRMTPVEKLIPKIEDIREEIAQDPHQTPQSLLNFAVELSEKMDVALRSREASEFLLSELKDCTAGEKVKTAPSASAACIKNAYELSAKYDELRHEADLVNSQADPEAQKIYKNMQNLGL